MDRGAWRATAHGVAKSETPLSNYHFHLREGEFHIMREEGNPFPIRTWCSTCWNCRSTWRKAWQPTPIFLPGESHGQRSLAGFSPWGHKDLDVTEHAGLNFYSCIDRLD